jgi:biotin carboxyl carrier protein
MVEPAPAPVAPRSPSVGHGLLGGVAPAVAAPEAPSAPELVADREPLTAAFDRLDADRGTLSVPDGGRHRVLLLDAATDGGAPQGSTRREVVVDGWRFEVEVEAAARAALRERARRGREDAGRSGPTEVNAIIPGVVVSVSVAAGDQVVAGQQLLVVEAMKMQNELRAPREGTIERVAVGPGTTIEVGDLLLVIS